MRETVAALREIDPYSIIPLHGTGEPFYRVAKADMSTKLLRFCTGTCFAFET